MRHLILGLLIVSAACSHKSAQRLPASPEYSGEMKVILSLKDKIDGKVVSTIEIFSNNIRPNVSSVDDKYRVEIDGTVVDIPEKVIISVTSSRGSYSSDENSGGIETVQPTAICMVGGPSSGSVLESRYLTYSDNYAVIKDELKPIYSEGACNFTEIYKPKKRYSELRASKAIAILQTVKSMMLAR